nr:hypothetical protein Itr_chr09CG06640 [Ipomoea trifida]
MYRVKPSYLRPMLQKSRLGLLRAPRPSTPSHPPPPLFAEKRKAGLPWSSDGATDDEEEDGWQKRSLCCMRRDFRSVSCEIGWCSRFRGRC